MLRYLTHSNFTSSMLGHPMIFPMLGHLRICPISVHLWICLIFVHLRIFPTELLFPPALTLLLSLPPTISPSTRPTWTYFCWTFLSMFFLQHLFYKKAEEKPDSPPDPLPSDDLFIELHWGGEGYIKWISRLLRIYYIWYTWYIKRLRDIQLTFPPYCRALAFFLF